jgi:hypothetical protein
MEEEDTQSLAVSHPDANDLYICARGIYVETKQKHMTSSLPIKLGIECCLQCACDKSTVRVTVPFVLGGCETLETAYHSE